MAFNTHISYLKFISGSNQKLFAFNFKLFVEKDLVVEVVVGSIRSTLRLNSDYTVTINGDAGGSILLNKPLAVDTIVILRRELDINRYVEYQTSGDMLATVLNDDQEYQTYLIQDQEGRSREYLKLPDNVPGFNGKFPIPGAGEFICWNAAGTNLTTKKVARGPQGPTGAIGPQGIQGVQGNQGVQGIQGIKGSTGTTGGKGDKGDRGTNGTGVNVKGVDTYANILKKNGLLSDMWITTDAGTDNKGNPYKIGYGVVSDGTPGSTQWNTVGNIQGPQGIQGIQGPIGTATVDFATSDEVKIGTITDKAVSPSTLTANYIQRTGGMYKGNVGVVDSTSGYGVLLSGASSLGSYVKAYGKPDILRFMKDGGIELTPTPGKYTTIAGKRIATYDDADNKVFTELKTKKLVTIDSAIGSPGIPPGRTSFVHNPLDLNMDRHILTDKIMISDNATIIQKNTSSSASLQFIDTNEETKATIDVKNSSIVFSAADIDGNLTKHMRIDGYGKNVSFFSMPTIGGSPIVESGENSNGSFTKFVDGTVIMSGKVSHSVNIDNPTGSLFVSPIGDIVHFPITVVRLPVVTVATNGNSSVVISATPGEITKTGFTPRVFATISTIVNPNIQWTAVGKWH